MDSTPNFFTLREALKAAVDALPMPPDPSRPLAMRYQYFELKRDLWHLELRAAELDGRWRSQVAANAPKETEPSDHFSA